MLPPYQPVILLSRIAGQHQHQRVHAQDRPQQRMNQSEDGGDDGHSASPRSTFVKSKRRRESQPGTQNGHAQNPAPHPMTSPPAPIATRPPPKMRHARKKVKGGGAERFENAIDRP